MRKTFVILPLILLFLIVSINNLFAAAGDVRLLPNPKIVQAGNDFTLEVHVDSGNEKLGSYQFRITYDTNLISLQNDDPCSVVPGSDGFLAAANCLTPGELIVNGFDFNGTEPGSDLHVLTITFKAEDIEDPQLTTICLEVEQLGNELGTSIGNPNGGCADVDIKTGVPLTVSVYPQCDDLKFGHVESNPPGINCPTNCDEVYEEGTPVTLKAIPAKGNIIFDRWEGDCSGAGPVCNLIMNVPKNVRAFFKVLIGDVDCDGQLTILDALLTARRSAGLPMEQTNWCGDQVGPLAIEKLEE